MYSSFQSFRFFHQRNGTHYAQRGRRYTSVSQTLRTNLKHIDLGNFDVFKQLRNYRETTENRAT